MGKKEHEALVIILILVLAVILGYSILPSLMGSTVYLYIFKPLFWLGLAVYVWKKPKIRFKGKLKLYNNILIWSTICSVLYITAYFAGGFLDGIGASPYARNFKGIAINVISFGSVIVLMECIRNYLVNRVKKKYIVFFSTAVVLVFTLYRLNLKIVTSLENWPQVVQYLGEYALPEIMNNILLTYMVYIGGAIPAIIYSTSVTVPMWVLPVLPDLKWITKAFIGAIMPVAFLLVMRQAYKTKTRQIKIREERANNPKSWIAVSIITIIMIWFALGVFQVFPTVILTGSMQPVLFPGDIALINKCGGDDIQVGDVIQFWTKDRIFIIHRVIEIDENGSFITKGDNNNAPDSKPVAPEQVKGKMIGVIPKLGMLNLLIKTADISLEQ